MGARSGASQIEVRPQIVHRVYRILPSEARKLYGVHAASFVPDEGMVDVHRYLLLTLNSRKLIIDATFPGPAWDGEHSMQFACGDGQDILSHGDADMEKQQLEREFCIPEVREPFIAALSTERANI